MRRIVTPPQELMHICRMKLYEPSNWTRLFLLLLFLSGTPLCAQGQLPASAGTDFYTALPFLAIADSAEFLLTITPVKPTTVTLNFIEDNSSVSQFVASGQSWEVRIPRTDIGVPLQQEMRSQRSVHITSTEPITVAATHNAPYFTDSWVVLPTDALGLDYRVSSVAAENTLGGVVIAIATEDNTTVRITPSVTTGSGNSPGFTYGIPLNRGEVWQIVPSDLFNTDLSGTRIQGDKPIVVLGGHAGGVIRPETDATNPMVETFLPVHQWGKEFYGMPLPDRDSGIYKITAFRANSVVSVNGNPIGTLQAGQSLWHVNNSPVHITATEPVQVAQFTHHKPADTAAQDADPTMSLLQSTNTWTTSWTWATPVLQPRVWPVDTTGNTLIPFRHVLVLTAPTRRTEPILLDGVDISGSLNVQYPNGAYKSGIIILEEGTHELQSDFPVAAQLVGYSHFDAYFLPAGYNAPAPAILDPVTTETCASTFDTVLTFRNSRFDTLQIEGVEFSGVAGQLTAPALPVTVLPFQERAIRFRFEGLQAGENRGAIKLKLKDGSVVEVEANVLIRQVQLAGMLLEPDVEFLDATSATPTRDTTLHLVNTGEGPLRLTHPGSLFPFQILEPGFPITVNPGDTAQLRVRFAPPGPGNYQEEFSFVTGPCQIQITGSLRGKRTDPAEVEFVIESGQDILCSDEIPGRITVKVYNRGGEPVTISGTAIEGTANNDYSVVTDPIGTIIPARDSTTLQLHFNPTDTGTRAAILRVLYNQSTNSVLAELSFRKDSARIEFQDSNATFGSQALCADPTRQSLTVHNTGTVPVRVDSIRFADGTHFTTTTSSGFSIATNNVGEISVAFAPTTRGQKLDTLIIYGSPCDVVARMPLAGNGLQASLAAITDTLSFGSLPLCLLPDTLKATFLNNGDLLDSITSIEIVGEGFLIATQVEQALKPNQQITIPVLFAPDRAGEFHGELILRTEPCGLERRVVLTGSAVDVAIASPIRTVEFRDITPNSIVNGSTTIHNTGPLPITVDSVVLPEAPTGLRVVSPTFPVIVASNDSIQIILEYHAATSDEFAVQGSIYASPCTIVEQFAIQGRSGLPHIEVILPHSSGNVNDLVDLPIRVHSDRAYTGSIQLRTEIRWKYQNLFPKRVVANSAGTFTVLSDSIDPISKERTWTFEYEGRIPADSVLGSLRALVLLGESDTTVLRGQTKAATAIATQTDLSVATQSGSFKTLGICVIDGHRFVRTPGQLQAGKPRPNPVSTLFSIEYYADSTDDVLLTVYDLAGKAIAPSRRATAQLGANKISLDMSSIRSGLYFYRLRLHGMETTGSFIVQH